MMMVGALALLAAASGRASAEPEPGAGSAQEGRPVYSTAEALLEALERAGDDIRTLRADVRYDRRFALQGDRHVRDGRLYFRATPGEGRAFAVHFETLRIDDRLQDDPQTWVFDGRWLVEKRPAQRSFVKREIAREGDDFDPLRIGEGPMPIPIGQKAEEILARYDAELLAPGDGLEALPAFLADSYQLRLTARRDAQAEASGELREVRLWYMRDTLLPRMARTVNRARDESYVVLLNLRINEELPSGAIDSSEPPTSEGWDVRVERIDDRRDGQRDERRDDGGDERGVR